MGSMLFFCILRTKTADHFSAAACMLGKHLMPHSAGHSCFEKSVASGQHGFHSAAIKPAAALKPPFFKAMSGFLKPVFSNELLKI